MFTPVPVRMVKRNNEGDQELVGQKQLDLGAHDQKLECAQEARKNVLAEVKSKCSGRVHVGIRVMHPVKAPQKRNSVVRLVPKIKKRVEHRKNQGKAEKEGPICAYQGLVSSLNPLGERRKNRSEHQRCENGGDYAEKEIHSAPACTSLRRAGFPEWMKPLTEKPESECQ